MIVINTNDGSPTVQLEDSGLTYHSKHGAIQESQHVFIDSGLSFTLQHSTKSELHIFEMGFGTGLNCLLSFKAVNQLPVKIYYTAIELYPLPPEVYHSLNYGTDDSLTAYIDTFERMHSAEWNRPVQLSTYFQLLKIKADITSVNLTDKYDIIYYDAFAPAAYPDQWTEAIFRKLADALNPESLLLTYSSRVSVRRALESVGFVVEKIPGPFGKREIVRARKQ
jgi:tRNA U34 5-methylaminomethyl-2-thiouridine-forming methyltransferase MnmC